MSVDDFPTAVAPLGAKESIVDRVARAIGGVYDGYADPEDTPSNWARAKEAAYAAIKEYQRAQTEGFKLD